MVEVVRRKRKPPILTPSSIPCLRQLPTINITQGCALGCTYCYIQGYSHYPGPNRVVLFENTAELVREELRRKRRMPSRVYFSPSSDAFQYLPQVREVSFQTMSLLLSAGIEVSFLTKGFVTDRFIRLFAEKPHLVFAQVGITTLEPNLWKRFEPRTSPPRKRVECLRALTEAGITTTARLDPLFPDVTDTQENLVPLLHCLRETGIRHVAASYIFLRPPFAARVSEQVNGLVATRAEPNLWGYQRFAK
ncbi:MAG: radical SAM protein, partial [Phycisphaerae bacterium]